MKKIIQSSLLILLFLIPVLITSSCKKDKLSNPVVKTISVISNGNGTIEITGKIISEGSSPIQYAGVCFGTDSVPALIENQVLTNVSNGTFVVDLDTLSEYITYYFRTFAANGDGYAAGNVIKFTTGPQLPPSAPCNLTNNIITENGFSYQISDATINTGNPYIGNFEIDADCYSTDQSFIIDFEQGADNGVYVTSTIDNLQYSNKNVYINVEYLVSGESYDMAPGSNVYVTKNSDGSYTVSFCSLTYGSSYTLSGKLTAD